MRISFQKGGQKGFIDEVLNEISIQRVIKICNLSERTIRDWRREKYLMSERAFNVLRKYIKTQSPITVEQIPEYWYTAIGSRKGGMATFKKYGKIGGDPEYRNKKWHEWWNERGKYESKFPFACKPIKKPRYSESLAEFVGILLGDGGISERQITISLHLVDDKEYSEFVIDLIEKLFAVPVKVSFRKKYLMLQLVISRSELVGFCVDKLGLRKGNKVKQQVDIPKWIKQNKNYSTSCLRGLMDTDGSVIFHRYHSGKKYYTYKKIGFTSRSAPLLLSVSNILKSFFIKHRISRKYDICIEAGKDVDRYFKVIGSSSPKHLKRYRKKIY